MASIQRFEDLKAWQSARLLAACVYKQTRNGELARDWAFRDQIQRSAVSVMSNIAEGFGRSGNREFLRFLYIARGSLMELKSQLYLASDMEFLEPESAAELTSHLQSTEKLLAGFIRYLEDHRGFEVAEDVTHHFDDRDGLQSAEFNNLS